MASSRTYPLSIIGVAAALFLVFFFAGFTGVQALTACRKAARKSLVADTIMTKRMQAIQASRKTGATTYEFEVNAPYPVLGGQ